MKKELARQFGKDEFSEKVMFSLIELKRRLENIVQVGTISETKTKEGKALARVILDDDGEEKRVTKFLPVLSFSNSFGKVWFPLRVDEQVLVISPFGNANSGFIIRSIFNRTDKEPDGSKEYTAIITFEDGARFEYNSKTSILKLSGMKQIVFDTEVVVTKDLIVNQKIYDQIGNLTDHKHSDSDGATSLPR